MKLIYLANIRIPTEKAHGIQIMKMCESFALAGLDVELVVPWRFNKIKKDPFDYYGVKKIFVVKKLPSLDLIPLPIPYLCFWVQSISFSISAFFSILFKKADYIYSRDLFPLFFLSKKNIIYESHYFPKHFRIYKRLFKKIRKLVVTTEKLKDFYKEKGISKERILVAPDGVDLEKFNFNKSQKECRQKLNLPLDKKIIGYIGQLKTMGRGKGVDDLIKSLKILRENNSSVILCLVGGRELDINEYRKLVLEMGLAEYILFIGQVEYSLIPYYLKSFDILTMPFPETNHYKYYMSPLKMFEYMVAKKLIIASDLPSIREVLSEKNAVLVKPNSPESLTEGINRALKNPDFYAKISEQAYQDVQKYSWQKRVNNILKFIK